MWPLYLIVPTVHGNQQRVQLHVQDYDVHNSSVLHLDARMSRSHFRSHALSLEDVNRLFQTHHDARTGATRPLLVLDDPYAVFLVASPPGGEQYVGVGAPILVQPVVTQSNGWIVLTSTDPGGDVSVRMWARETAQPGRFAVWRINCTVHTARLERGSKPAAMMSRARMQHVYAGSLLRARRGDWINVATGDAERHFYDHGLVDAAPRADSEPMPSVNARPEHFVQTCLAWSYPTMTARLPSDGVMLRALNVGYSVEAGHSLLHSAVGQHLLRGNTDPSAAIAANPNVWINEAVGSIHGGMSAPQPWSDDYRRDAERMNQRLIEGLLDRVEGWFKQMQGKVPNFLQPFMPGEKTIGALRSINVTKTIKTTAGAAKTAASSKTMAAVVSSLVKRDTDVVLLQEWGKAVLGDAKLDDSVVGTLLVENAPAVQEGALKAFNKFKSFAGANLTAGKLRDYGATFRQMIGSQDLRDGVYQLAAAATKAGKYVGANSGKIVGAAKATGSFVAKHSDTIVAVGKTAASAAAKGAVALAADSIDEPC